MSSLLRTAVARCTTLCVPWRAEDVSALSGVDAAHCLTYLRALAKDRVVLDRGEGRFAAGPAAGVWRRTPSKTKRGGNSKDYRRGKEAWDRLATADFQARRSGGGLTGQPMPTSDSPCQPLPTTYTAPFEASIAMLTEQLIPLDEVAPALAVSRRTLLRWIASRRMAAVKVGQQWRVAAGELARIQKGGITNGEEKA